VNLNDVAVESVQHSRRYARHSSVNLGLQLFEAAEAEAEPVVHGDGELLRIAIDNLIRNAIQHSEPGTTVDVRVERRDGHASVAVRDQGPGIPQEYLPRIFDRFVQAPADRPADGAQRGVRGGGLGLGLAIAKAVVDLHKGEISAETREPRGACFAIRLPVAVRTADTAAKREG
jgi:signal transduction histidine kinase